ncbi:MAG: hypothetical protein IJV58_04290 [Oscillospiraceae bacterium]|nr:hypothetical protein [Oscillospiraceae bacterium]
MNRHEELDYSALAIQQQYTEEIRLMPPRPQTYHVVTYGCQMNAHDSEKIAGMLQDMGLTEAPVRDEADFVIFNTCCVRENAERRALGNVTWLKEVRKRNPKLMIGVCGCMIQEPGWQRKSSTNTGLWIWLSERLRCIVSRNCFIVHCTRNMS